MNFLFGFYGRINRMQWWIGILSFIVLLFATTVAVKFTRHLNTGPNDDPYILLYPIVRLASILLIWPLFAICAKRFQDRNKSGLWAIILLHPMGLVWLLIECGFLKGNDGDNSYGVAPEQISFLKFYRKYFLKTSLADEPID